MERRRSCCFLEEERCSVFLLTLAVCLGAIALLNFVVNPLGYFSTHKFAPMVWNGRAEKVAALAADAPKPQVLVLGSSRVWMDSPAKLTELTGMPSFNAGVSAAKAEDDYALLRYAVEQAHIEPKVVLVGVDLEALHNAWPVDNRLLDVAELRGYLPSGGMDAVETRVKSLVAAQSLGLSLKSIRMTMRGNAETPADPLYTVSAHGDTHLSGVEHRLESGQSTREKEYEAQVPVFLKRYRDYREVSAERMNYLRLIVEYCAQRHIKTVVYLTPMGKAMQGMLNPLGYQERRHEIVSQLTPIAKANGAVFEDYTDVESFGGSEDGFLDGAHMDHANGDILLVKMLKDTGVIQ